VLVVSQFEFYLGYHGSSLPFESSHRVHRSSRFLGRHHGVCKGYSSSSDGSWSIVSRQLRPRRFCRRSQLQNSWSQRRHVVNAAYGPSFGALRWGPFGGPFRRMVVLSGHKYEPPCHSRHLTQTLIKPSLLGDFISNCGVKDKCHSTRNFSVSLRRPMRTSQSQCSSRRS